MLTLNTRTNAGGMDRMEDMAIPLRRYTPIGEGITPRPTVLRRPCLMVYGLRAPWTDLPHTGMKSNLYEAEDLQFLDAPDSLPAGSTIAIDYPKEHRRVVTRTTWGRE